MNIYIITTLFVYAVLLHRGLKNGGTLDIMSPAQNVGVMSPASPVSCIHEAYDLKSYGHSRDWEQYVHNVPLTVSCVC